MHSLRILKNEDLGPIKDLQGRVCIIKRTPGERNVGSANVEECSEVSQRYNRSHKPGGKSGLSSRGNFAPKFQPGIDQFLDTIHFKK